MLLLLICANFGRSLASMRHTDNPNAGNFETIKVAQAQVLTKGYTRYWSGNINTYLAHGVTAFIPTKCEGGVVQQYDWLIDTAMLRNAATESFYEGR